MRVQYLILALLMAGLLSMHLGEPFWGNHEFNGVYYGQIARNYSRYGLVETKGGQVNNLLESDRSEWNFHLNHPATYPLLLYGVTSSIGLNEVSLRLVSIFASVAGLVLLAKLLEVVFEDKGLWLVVLPIMVTPLFLYYGSVPVFEPILFPVVVAGLLAFWNDRRLLVWSACLAAMLIDWPGYWLAGWLMVIELVGKRRRGMLVGLLATIIVATGLILVHQKIVSGFWLKDLLGVGGFRFAVQPYSMAQWIRTLVSRTKAFWGLPIIIVAGLGLLRLAFDGNRERKVFVLGVLGMSVSHIFVFKNIAWYHDYMLYHSLPMVGLLIAGVFVTIRKWFGAKAVLMASLTMVGLTVWQTGQFYSALVTQRPFKKCVEIGKMVGETNEVLSFKVTKEEAQSCPPYIGFYGDREFELVITD